MMKTNISRRLVMCFCNCFLSLTIACVTGCPTCLGGDAIGLLFVTGQIVDQASNKPLTVNRIVVSTLRESSVTGTELAVLMGDRVNPRIPLDEPGAFYVVFGTDLAPVCASPFGPRVPPPDVPRPDQIELTITLADCEQTVVIDINDITVLDPTAPDDVIEFRDPILIPPCEDNAP